MQAVRALQEGAHLKHKLQEVSTQALQKKEHSLQETVV